MGAKIPVSAEAAQIFINFIKGLIVFNWEDFPNYLLVILIANFIMYRGQYAISHWQEFKFPVLWCSDEGIGTYLIFMGIPLKVMINWKDIVAIKDALILFILICQQFYQLLISEKLFLLCQEETDKIGYLD